MSILKVQFEHVAQVHLDLARLGPIFSKWEGTPHVPGQRCAGRGPGCGVDCVHLVDAVLEEFLGMPGVGTFPRMPQDATFHSPRALARVVDLFRRRYSLVDVDTAGPFIPLDLICMAEPGPRGNPFHVGIVSADIRVVWHAIPSGVVRTSVQACRVGGFRIARAFRSPLAATAALPPGAAA